MTTSPHNTPGARGRLHGNRPARTLAQWSGALGSLGATAALTRAALRRRDGEIIRALVNSLPDAVLGVDAAGEVIAANAATSHVLGLAPEEMRGHRPLHPSLRWSDELGTPLSRANDPLADAISSGVAAKVHLRFQREDRAPLTHVRAQVTPATGESGPLAAAVSFTDVTEEVNAQRSKTARAALEHHRSLYDHLTGLPNRPMLLERLAHARERSWRSATASAILVIDLDGLAAINEVLGHEAGDEVLVQVAVRLKSAMRATDTPCRVGDDDFVVLCEDISLDDADAQIAMITDRVTQALEGPYLTTTGTTSVASAVGVAVATHPEQVHAGLIAQAERAMRTAKAAARERQADMPTVVSTDRAAVPPADAISVVLVDGDEAMRLLTRRVLHGSSHGFRVIGEASGGREAIDRIAQLQPDLVVSDLLLDDMHISDLIREVRSGRPVQRFLLWATPQEGELQALADAANVPWLDKGQIDALTDAAMDAAATRLEGA